MRKIMRIFMLAVLVVFLCSVTLMVIILHQYKESDRMDQEIADQYARYMAQKDRDGQGAKGQDAAPGADEAEAEAAPVAVDFQGLLDFNEDVCGWIYCEDTPIDYPVAQGEDNDFYLRRKLDGSHNTAGTIFVEAQNSPDFADSNTIIYGHHMRNGSMFAVLDSWADQEFYEAHPVMWLLTPEQNYKIVLFSGYTTSATSDTYTIFQGPGEELDAYLAKCVEQSDFHADVELDSQGRYVLLSTCAYVFDNARYVLHGMLVPVGGG